MVAKKTSSRKLKQKGSNASFVHQHLPLIHTMKKTKNLRLRNQILDLSPDTVKALASIAENAVQGNIPLSKGQRLLINKNQKQLCSLFRATPVNKKKILQQKGGGIFGVLSTILPAVVGALGSVLGSNKS